MCLFDGTPRSRRRRQQRANTQTREYPDLGMTVVKAEQKKNVIYPGSSLSSQPLPDREGQQADSSDSLVFS